MSPNSGLVPQSDRSVSGLGVDSGVGVSGSGFGAGQSGGDNQANLKFLCHNTSPSCQYQTPLLVFHHRSLSVPTMTTLSRRARYQQATDVPTLTILFPGIFVSVIVLGGANSGTRVDLATLCQDYLARPRN
ncbi:hypothetical protein RRG08_041889 [Elysia crispata]|uniref:Uncharacterized protein n=1 Tax=Elysia crispata TaxID=231223 RepID=A0AAE0Y0S6_9GAST|nr:hypothetical protein RRG08_041889 [Elysia crispata]